MHASTRNDDPTLLLDQWTRQTIRFRRRCRSINFEEYEHAIARGATIYCEIGGGGMSAYYITAPHPDVGAKNVMLNCLRDAGLKPTDVDGVNMHGTSTH
jgi:3-oxoacyl-[acyl-carrier-protein] synthase II